jgi:mannose-6-phosphate isomerase-like protein (cupin superfamily)
MHQKIVQRPWGNYTVIKQGKGYKTKIIEVLPGRRLSLQSHEHRSEHWVVVQGVAKITHGRNVIFLEESQSSYIPKQTRHRLENPEKKKKLRIIEVQCGDYTGEDDIQRFDDDHGRCA